jgi:hypothetical protein
MPHSYGASLAAVQLRGDNFDAANIEPAANNVDSTSKNRIGKYAAMFMASTPQAS